jgi:Diaphanous FH3 Domain
MSFINAVICGGPGDELAFRMHMRFEFIQLGLLKLIDKITLIENEVLQTQIDVFLIRMENDEGECYANLDMQVQELNMDQDHPEVLSELLNTSLRNTSCESSYLSILKHLSLLPHSPLERYCCT